jgi:hypothetical protein
MSSPFALFVPVSLERGSCFLPRKAWTVILLSYAYHFTGMTDAHLVPSFYSWDAVSWTFILLGWPRTGFWLRWDSNKHFAWTGLEPWFSQCQSPKLLGEVTHQCQTFIWIWGEFTFIFIIRNEKMKTVDKIWRLY